MKTTLTTLCLLAWLGSAEAQVPTPVSCTPNIWNSVSATCDGPTAVYGASGCPGGRGWGTQSFDPTTNEALLFGGGGSSYLSDTWTYNLTENVWRNRRPGAGAVCQTSYQDQSAPCRRDNHNLIYNPVDDHHWAFNGTPYEDCQSDCSIGFQTALGKAGIWRYSRSGNTWSKVTDMSGALHRHVAPAMVYNPTQNTAIEFGGDGTASVKQNTTYRYDLSARTVTLVSPTGGVKPSPRNNLQGCFVYVAHRNEYLLFGGKLASGNAVGGDTWSWNDTTSTWTDLTATIVGSPTAREKHACVYHPPSGHVLMWGGEDVNNASMSDTWALNLDASPPTWTHVCGPSPACGLPAQRYMMGHYFPPTDRIVSSAGLAGGASGNTYQLCYDPAVPTFTPAGTPTVTSTVPVPPTATPTQTSPPTGTSTALVPPTATPPPAPQPTATDTALVPPTQTPPATGTTAPAPPTATATATPQPTATSTPTQVPAASGIIALTPGVWKVVTPRAGQSNPMDQTKHTRNVFNPTDGKVYTMSGDWTTGCTATTGGNCSGTTNGSYRNEIFSYTVQTNTWTRETDYCAYPNVQPQRPDYNAVAYDSTRNLFWMHGGYQDAAIDSCTQTAYTRNQLMWWSPDSKQWDGPAGRLPMSTIIGTSQQALTKSAFYDAQTDAVWWPHQDNRPGMMRYNIAANTWTRYRFDGPSTCDNDARFGDVGLSTYDSVARIAYVLEQKSATSACPASYRRLWKINVACLAAGQAPTSCLAYESLPTAPIAVRAGHDHERVIWNSVDNILLYPYQGGQTGIPPDQFQFSVWTPPLGYPATWANAGSWDVVVDYMNGIQPVTDPPGHCASPQAACSDGQSGAHCCLLRGNALAFDPAQNAFVLFGTARRDAVPGASRYMYLWRYPGTGTPTSAEPTATATATHTPTGVATAAPADTPTTTPASTATAIPLDTLTPTPAATETSTATAIPTDTVTATPTQTAAATETSTSTAIPTNTATAAPTQTPAATETSTATAIPTDTVTATPTQTAAATETSTSTAIPTNTATAAPTQTPVATATQTPTAIPTDTASATPTRTSTATPTRTLTTTPSATPTRTRTNTPTPKPTRTRRRSQLSLSLAADTPTATATPTLDGHG